jgi:hypothetical protein
MYALARKNGHAVWKEQWYALTLRFSLRADLYMTQKNQVFITNVVVTNSTWEAVASSVIAKLNSIVKICKYKRAS